MKNSIYFDINTYKRSKIKLLYLKVDKIQKSNIRKTRKTRNPISIQNKTFAVFESHRICRTQFSMKRMTAVFIQHNLTSLEKKHMMKGRCN